MRSPASSRPKVDPAIADIIPAMRAIDFHVHLPTPEWLDGSMGGYLEAAEAYFRSPVARRSLDELADDYRRLGMMAVLLAWDAETATGRPRLSNEFVANAVFAFPDVFIGFGSVDPGKGERAVAELDEIAALGLKGVKFHPSLQAFAPDDETFWPVFARSEELGLATIFHTGTSGMGAGQPGGQGIRLDYARPIRLDAVAATFPNLQIVAAHFGFPWHLEMLAIALHKSNVWIDISGWAPRYLPPEVIRDMRGRLQDRFLFGSDYPFIQPARCLEELGELELPEPVLEKVLLGNARRLLALD
jgi:predicted TIM-barrel fold metal-dependent hydrolase